MAEKDRKQWNFTEYMAEVVEGVKGGFTAARYICREDIEQQHKEMMRQKNTSSYLHRKKELVEKLQACGLSCTMDDWEEAYTKALQTVPSGEELQEKLFQELYRIYQEFPVSADYMARLIHRLGDAAKEGDSLRMAIVKQFVKHTEYHTEPVHQWVLEKLGKESETLTRERQVELTLEYLDETIFENLSVELTASEWAGAMLEKISPSFLQQAEVEEAAALKQHLMGTAYDFGWNTEQKLRFLQETTLPQAKEELRAFLKQMEQAVFALLQKNPEKETYQDRKKALRRSKRARLQKDWHLLLLADHLAKGYFRKGGDTKELLYLFAMAFGMKTAAEVEKNLFHDFYNHDLLRYISDHYRQNASEYEEPAGEGINYKNFAEVIYLYYIEKEGLSPAEKIKKAEEMIAACMKKGGSIQAEPLPFTAVYKKKFLEEISKLKEEELKKYLCKSFQIPKKRKTKTVLQAAAQQATALEQYQWVLGQIEKDYSPEDIYYMNWAEMRDFPDFCEADADFISLLDRMNDLLHLEATKRQMMEQQKKDRRMKVTSLTLFEGEANPVTRTELLVAYFYYYSLSERGVGMNMAEMFDDFYGLVDPVLEKCRYQKLSEKNLFDMFLIFSLYRSINLV